MELILIFFDDSWQLSHLHADPSQLITNSPWIALMQDSLVQLSFQVLLCLAVLQENPLL